MTVPVLFASFTKAMLSKRTRPQAQISTGTAIEILKLESLLGAYSIHRQYWNRLFLAPSPSLDSHPAIHLKPLGI